MTKYLLQVSKINNKILTILKSQVTFDSDAHEILVEYSTTKDINKLMDENPGKLFYENGKVILKDILNKEPLVLEMFEIENWLLSNDYRVNKYILGEYQDGDPVWEQYKQDRLTKINRLNEIEVILNG